MDDNITHNTCLIVIVQNTLFQSKCVSYFPVYISFTYVCFAASKLFIYFLEYILTVFANVYFNSPALRVILYLMSTIRIKNLHIIFIIRTRDQPCVLTKKNIFIENVISASIEYIKCHGKCVYVR